MRIRYDQQADALYITLLEGEPVSRTEQLDEGTLVDLDMHGHAIGVEVIRPARTWPLDALLQRFRVDEGDAAALRSLWHERYPFEREREDIATSA